MEQGRELIRRLLLALTLLVASPSLYAGTVTGTLQGPSGITVKNATLTFTLAQAGSQAIGTGNIAQLTSQCFTSSDGTVVGVPNPLALPIVGTNTSAGSLPAGIYYVELTYFNGSGESLVSPELQIQLTSTGALIVALPTSGLPASATGIHVYMGTSRGAETLQGSFSTAFPGTYAQNIPLAAGATPPGSNTAPCTIAFNDTIIPFSGYNVSLTSSSGNAYPGWPQAWQLNGGASGTVNVSAGAPLWNGVVIYPSPVLQQPLNHGPQGITGNLNMNGYDLDDVGNIYSQYVNTIPQADQFPGSDASVKIRAAETYAITNGINQVDATHFSGIQGCSVDMFGALNSNITAPVNLVVNFGAVHFQCSVQQTITNSAITLRGMGPMMTQIEYIGSSSTAVLWAHAQTSGATAGLTGVTLDGIFFYGGAGNVTDALLLEDMNRSNVSNVSAWGATGCGIHTQGTVTTTLFRPKVSGTDAGAIGISNSGHTVPANGICFDRSPSSNNQTTNGTMTDGAAEFLQGIGWYFESAQGMTTTGGTSESNAFGIKINTASFNKFNTFISPDLESNTANIAGVDVNDQGQQNYYIDLIATSACSGPCNSVIANGIGQYIFGDADLATGFTGFGVIGVNSHIGFPLGSVSTVEGLKATQPIVNSTGMEMVQAAGCAITPGAIGNSCSATITFLSAGGVNMNDANYKAVCQLQGTGGSFNAAIGDVRALSASGLIVQEIALDTVNTGGGQINCLLVHN